MMGDIVIMIPPDHSHDGRHRDHDRRIIAMMGDIVTMIAGS